MRLPGEIPMLAILIKAHFRNTMQKLTASIFFSTSHGVVIVSVFICVRYCVGKRVT